MRDVELTVDDIEAIRQLKAHYVRTTDTKDWAGMRLVFGARLMPVVRDAQEHQPCS
jgi:hypothetical protein